MILSTRGGGACVVVGGNAWLWGACMVAGGVHGCGGHAWWWGCVVAGGHAWLHGGGVRGCGIRRDTVNERAVRILLECILVIT